MGTPDVDPVHLRQTAQQILQFFGGVDPVTGQQITDSSGSSDDCSTPSDALYHSFRKIHHEYVGFSPSNEAVQVPLSIYPNRRPLIASTVCAMERCPQQKMGIA